MITKSNIKIPIYGYTIKIEVFDNYEEIEKKYPLYMEGRYACTIEYKDKSYCTIIVPSDDFSSIIHEVVHAKNLIFKFIGYTIDTSNDETEAYLVGFIVHKIEEIIKKHLKLAQ